MKTGIIIIGMVFSLLEITNAQTTISLQEAIDIVQTQHPTIQQQNLYIEQQTILKDKGKQQPAMGIGYSMEEFGVAGFGVHSIYVQQDFNMPQVAQSQSMLQAARAKAGIIQKEVTKKELKQYVAKVYQQLCFLKSQTQLNQELKNIYKNIEVIANKRAAVGESGQLPSIAIQSTLQQLALQQMSIQRTFDNQLEVLKQFLMDSTINNIASEGIKRLDSNPQLLDLNQHPIVQKTAQDIAVNQAQTQVLKSQLLPQISTGIQTQVVDRTYPNFGAQIGLNVPIFRKGVKAQIKANELNNKLLAQNKQWQLQQLKTQEKIALQNIEQLQQQLEYIESKVLPTLQQQQDLNKKTFAIGETNYLTILQSLQQIITAKNTYLNLLLQLNIAWIDYQFLMTE